MRTLRAIALEGWPGGVYPPGFHWPWDGEAEEPEGMWSLDQRGKCLHCEDIYDDLPAKKTLGDLLWDGRFWVCGTPGCDGTLIDWFRESSYRRPVNGPKPAGA